MHITLHINPNTFAALRSKTYRTFLMGQSVALTGLWLQRLTNIWLVYQLTDSAFKVGLIEFTTNAPIFLFGLFVGAWIDKHDNRKTLLATQLSTMIVNSALFLLLISGMVEYWHLLIICFTLGVITAIDLPTRQNSVVQLIDDASQLKSAVSIHSMVFNTSRLIGPALAGVIIYNFGEIACYAVSTLCYIPIVVILSKIKFRELHTVKNNDSPIKSTIDGIKYVGHSYVLRSVFSFLVIFAFFGYVYTILFPIFAQEVLHGDSKLLGYLMGGVGLGAVFGALFVGSVSTIAKLPRYIWICSSTFIFFMTLFAFSPSPLLSVLLTIPAGFGLIGTFVSTNTLIQSIADEDKRGRVISIYIICNMGMGPIGTFIAGILADMIGAKYTFLFCLSVMLCGVIMLYIKLPKINSELNKLLEAKKSQ